MEDEAVCGGSKGSGGARSTGQCLGRGRNMGSRILGTALRWFAGDRRGGSCHCRGQEAVSGSWCHGAWPRPAWPFARYSSHPSTHQGACRGKWGRLPIPLCPRCSFPPPSLPSLLSVGECPRVCKALHGLGGLSKDSFSCPSGACAPSDQPTTPCWPGSLPIIPLAKRLRCGGALGFRAEMPPSPFSPCALDWEVQQGDAAGDMQGGTSLS